MSTNVLEQAIHEVLENEAFEKKKRTWYLPGDETVLVISLQKSNWGEQYYINLGLLVRSLNNIQRPPKDVDCHILIRLSTLLNNIQSGTQIEKILDLENREFSDEQRAFAIKDALKDIAIPLLKRLTSLAEIRNSLGSNELRGAAIRKEVQVL